MHILDNHKQEQNHIPAEDQFHLQEVNSSRYDKFKNKSDVEVWSSFKSGDEQAFIFIYKTYANILFNYGCQFSRNREIVKDSIQDIFITLKKREKSLGNIISIKGYLMKCIRRDILRRLNKERRLMYISNHMPGQFDIILLPDLKFIKDQFDFQQKAQLEIALKQLPQRQKEAILLYYFEELSYKEVADIMGLSMVKSARKLIYRGIDSLKGKLMNIAHH